MVDPIPKPHIRNVITNSTQKFKLYVMAYRKLTPNELKYCLAQYLRAKGLKKVPASGEAEMITSIGSDDKQYRPFD